MFKFARHVMSLKDFNSQFMVGKEGKEEDEDLPSTSKSSSTSLRRSFQEDEEVVEIKNQETPKDKLVENDNQW